MGRPAIPHPPVVCAKHPAAPRRWKQVRVPGMPHRISVCVFCSPPTGQPRCVNGHVGARERRRCDGRLICRVCARAATELHRKGRRGLMAGDAWARNAAAVERGL